MFFLAFPLLLYTQIYSITAMLFRVRPASAVKIRIAWKFPLEPQFCVCFVKQRIECPCSIHCYSNGNGAKCSPYFFSYSASASADGVTAAHCFWMYDVQMFRRRPSIARFAFHMREIFRTVSQRILRVIFQTHRQTLIGRREIHSVATQIKLYSRTDRNGSINTIENG